MEQENLIDVNGLDSEQPSEEELACTAQTQTRGTSLLQKCPPTGDGGSLGTNSNQGLKIGVWENTA